MKRTLRLRRDTLPDLRGDELGLVAGGITNETGTLCPTQFTYSPLKCLGTFGLVDCLSLRVDLCGA